MTTKTSTAAVTGSTSTANSAAAKHLREIPKFIWIAEQVARTVSDSMSHDRLNAVRLAEIGELLDGPEPMLKVVWAAHWRDGHVSTLRYIISGEDAECQIDKLRIRMEHRLLREVFREDASLNL